MSLLNLTKSIVRQQTISQVEVNSITDLQGQKIIRAEVTVEVLGPRALVLWEGDEYDQIGNWTQAQAEARIKELLDSQIKS